MTKKQIVSYFEYKPKNSKEWIKIKSVGIYILKSLNVPKNEIMDIVNVSNVTYWRLTKTEITNEMISEFKNAVKKCIYPISSYEFETKVRYENPKD